MDSKSELDRAARLWHHLGMVEAVHLERYDPGRNLARFYRLELDHSLFGEVMLIRRWGRIGTAGRMAGTVMACPDAARRALTMWHMRKLRRGYRLAGEGGVPPLSSRFPFDPVRAIVIEGAEEPWPIFRAKGSCPSR